MSEKLPGFCWNTIYSIPVSKFYQTIELKHTTLYYKNWFLFKVGNFDLTAHSNWVIKHNHIFFRTFFKPHHLFSIRFFSISLIIIPWIRISLSDMQWQKNKAKLFYIFKGVLYSDTLLYYSFTGFLKNWISLFNFPKFVNSIRKDIYLKFHNPI